MEKHNNGESDVLALESPALPKLAEFPERVTVELTNRCNLACTMCPRHLMEGKLGSMSFELYKKIIDELAGHKPLALIPFMRGESMLHRKFVEMLEYAKSKDIGPIQIATNASMMKKEIAMALVDLEIDFVSFSIDSIDPETYASIRVNGKLDKVLANIDYFCYYREKKKSRFPEVQVSVVKTGRNQDQVDDFVRHWQGKVDRIRVFEQHTSDGNFGSIGALKDKFKFDKRLPCHKVFNEISIYWNGEIALCCHDWDRKKSIGNVAENSIAQIWKNKRYSWIRETHLEKHDQMEELCRNCDQWKAYYLPQGSGTLGEVF